MSAAFGRALEGKVVLVTGGSRGIGAAIAEAAAQAGASVAVMARTQPSATAERVIAAGGRAIAIAGDVSVEADAEAAVAHVVAQYGRIDVLVNNAAVLGVAPLLTGSVELFDEVMAVNVRGPFLMTRAAGRIMAERGSGVIINIGSDLAERGRAEYVSYAASKGALLQMTRSAAIELGAAGVRVVLVSPAVTNTEMAAPVLSDPVLRAEFIAKGTLDTVNEPEDVAATVVFLASPAARTVTGCNWPVDAGVLAR